MNRILMMKGARILTDLCAAVKEGEKVLIVTDTDMVEIAEVLAAAVHERRAELTIAVMTPRKIDGEEPTSIVSQAMQGAEVIFMPVSKSLAHTTAVRAALAKGARVLSMTAFTEGLMIHGGIEADFIKQKPVCEKVASILTQGKRARLSSPAGTHITMSIEGRTGNAHACVITPGKFSAVPNIEANISPVEGTSEGTIVADASIPYMGIGLLAKPIRFFVSKGAINKIEGGSQAIYLENILAEQHDPNVYNIAQLAIGLNPMIPNVTGIMLNDEGAFGTVHIGIGTSSNIGGVVKASAHFDLVMSKPTLEVDGNLILQDGELKI
jgi:leucyl aminopeptidase (aminopeptidase T)